MIAVAARQLAASALSQSANRQFLVRAQFQAEGCAAALISATQARLGAAATTDQQDAVWATLADSIPPVTTSPCLHSIRPLGDQVDVNGADTMALRSALIDMAGSDADRLYDLLMDWRDRDGDVRPGGRERPGYQSLGLWGPADGRIASLEQLLDIPEFAPYRRLLPAYVGVDDAPLWTGRTSAVLSQRTVALSHQERLPVGWEVVFAIPAPVGALCAAVRFRVVRDGAHVVVARRLVRTVEQHRKATEQEIPCG
ncbi:MAG: general secretion pathway protein GspK [Gemmatimonadaceae bacterium]|nr:general secretion pathway protein GspK [Gemmatimonadaceae bacterium]